MYRTRIAKISALLAAAVLLPAMANAQSYYDDDIYYDSSKAKQKVKEQKQQKATTQRPVAVQRTSIADYPAADMYNFDSGSTRNVDEYNRHGQFLVPDTVIADSITPQSFAATRRLEAFHNSDIVTGSDDVDLQAMYYADQPTSNVNIYLVNDWAYPYWSTSWTWGIGSPWYSLRWGWNSPWYDPYWAWGPSWS